MPFNLEVQRAASGPGKIAQQTRMKQRIGMMLGEFPGLANQYDVVVHLAQQNVPDEVMMEGAVGALGMSEITRIAGEMKQWDKTRQRTEWGVMSPQKQNALLNAGYEPVMEKTGSGGGNFFTKGVGKIASGGAWAFNKVTGVPGVKQSLAALDWMGEEVSRPARVSEYAQSGAEARKRLEEKGINPDEFSERTGIFLPGGIDRDDASSFFLSQLASKDFWRTWNHVGHEGDDDYLPTRQIEAYDHLESLDPENVIRNFQLAKAIASGKDVHDMAEEEGFTEGTPEWEQYVTEVYTKRADGDFMKAADMLTAARMSPGRRLARDLGVEDGNLDDWSSPGRWISGSVDATFSILFDPTLALGKAGKGAKAARWGLRSGESMRDIERFRQSAHIYAKSQAGEDVVRDVANLTQRTGWARRSMSDVRDTVAEGKAVHGAADRIRRALDKTDEGYSIANLVRDMPQIAPAVHDLKVYRSRTLATKGREMDVDDVFDFYLEAAGGRAVAGGTGRSIGATSAIFGVDPRMQLIPHDTRRGMAILRGKDVFRKALIDGERDDALAKAIEEVVEEADELGHLGDDLAEVDAVLEPDRVNELMNWAPESRGKVKQFLGAFTTHVADRSIALEGQEAIEDFSRLVEYGSFAQMPRAAMDRYFNMFVDGNTAERAAVANVFIADLLEHGGVALDESGRAFRDKFLGHARQAYGIGDQLALGRITEADAKAVLTRDAILSSQLSDRMAVPSFKEFIYQTRKANKLRAVAGRHQRSAVEAFMGKVWKPTQMMRMGFIFRNAGEEVLGMVLRNTSKDYIRAKFATDWMAGLKGAAINRSPELANSAWMRPITAVTHGMRSIVGMTDEALEEAATARVLADPEWLKLSKVDQDAMLSLAKSDILGNRKFIPKSVDFMDEFARFLSKSMSQGFHAVAQAAHIPSKQRLGEMLAGDDQNALMVAHKMLLSGQATDHWMDMVGKNTFRQATGFDRDPTRYMLQSDPANPMGLKAVKMKLSPSNYAWSSHDQIESFYWSYASQIDSMASSVQGKAALKTLSGYVNPSTRKAVREAYGIKVEDDTLNEIRRKIMDLSDADKAVMRTYLKTSNPTYLEELTDEDVYDIALKFKDANFRVKDDILSPDGVAYAMGPSLGDPLDSVRATMVNRIYQSLRRQENESIVRKSVRMNANIANPIPDGVSRLYMPMADRRTSEGIVTILSTPEGAEIFAKNLERELGRRGLKRLMPTVWDGIPPGNSGFSVSDFMDTILGHQVLDGGQWIPSAPIASRNADVAFAVRDAMASTFDEMGSPQLLTPTVGYLDFDSTKMTEDFGLFDRGEEIFNVEPTTAIKATPIDPTRITTQLKIKTRDGEVMWVGVDEADQVAGPLARANVDEIVDNKIDSMVQYDKWTKSVKVNEEAIKTDWDNGANFLRGTRRVLSKRVQTYKFKDEAKAIAVKARLNRIVFDGKTVPDLDSLTAGYRRMKPARKLDLDEIQVTPRLTDDDLLMLTREEGGDMGKLLDELQGMRNQFDLDFEEMLKGEDAKLGELNRMFETGPLRDPDELIRASVPAWVWEDPVWGPIAEEGIITDVLDLVKSATAPKGATKSVINSTEGADVRMMSVVMEQIGVDPDKLIRELGSAGRYKDFIVAREKAHLGLRHRYIRPGTEITPENIEKEAKAIGQALRDLGLDVEKIALPDRKVEVPAFTFADDGEDAYKVLDSIIGSGDTEDLAVRKAAEDAAQHVMNLMVGKNGEVMHELLHHINAKDFDMSDLWRKGTIQDMPEKVFGPQYVNASDGKWENIVNGYFDGWANPAISALSRTPMFRFNVSKAQEELKWVRDNMIDDNLDSLAKGTLKAKGIDPEHFDGHIQLGMNSFEEKLPDDDFAGWAKAMEDGNYTAAEERLKSIFDTEDVKHKFSEQEMQTLHQWTKNHNVAWNTWRDASLEKGRRMTIPFIDDSRVRSQFQEYIGSLIPFWYSEEQFLKRMVRGIAQTPEMIRKGQLMMHGLRSMGVVRRDENGNEIFVYPGSEQGLEVIGKVADMVTGGMLTVPTAMPLTSRTANMIPGYNSETAGRFNFGPMVGLPMEYMARRYPEWEDAQSRMFGDNSGRDYLSYLVPAAARNLYQTVLGDMDKGQHASAQLQAIQLLEAAGKGLPEDATPLEKERFLEDMRAAARTVSMIRMITGFSTFTTAIPKDMMPISGELREMMANGVEWGTAVELMVEKYGASALPYTVFGSERSDDTNAPLPVTRDAAAFMDENADYLTMFKSAAPWLLPAEKVGDKFSSRAYDEMLALELRRRRSPEEMLNAMYIAQAAPTFYEMQEEAYARINAAKETKNTELEKQLKEDWAMKRDAYYLQHPVFAADRTTGEGHARRRKTLDEMKKIVHDPFAPQSDALEDIREMVLAFEQYENELEALKSIRGERGRQMKKKLTEQFRLRQWLEAKPIAKRFYASVIAPEIEGDDVTLSQPSTARTS